jgi:hypothetical protein
VIGEESFPDDVKNSLKERNGPVRLTWNGIVSERPYTFEEGINRWQSMGATTSVERDFIVETV